MFTVHAKDISKTHIHNIQTIQTDFEDSRNPMIGEGF